MIGRRHRFHGYNSLRGVYSRGKAIRGSLTSMKVSPAKGNKYRAAVVVSKKVSKSAVVRNRIRRRVYEILRTSQLATEAYDVIVSVYSDQLATMPAAELQELLQDQLHQAGIGAKSSKSD